MENLTLTLLGGVAAATADSAPVQFRTDKIRALLVYLALEGDRPHQRSSLAALLWPEMPEQTALKNLRQSLHRLQQTLDEQSPGLSAALFTVTRQTMQGNPSLVDVDVLNFQALLLACERHPHRHLHLCHDCLARLERAAALYQGELLAGFGLPNAAAFEEWMLFRRERLQQQAINALGRLAAAQAERGENETALAHAYRLIALDPYWEESHRLIMRLLARGGQHGKALAQYESLARLLQTELGIEPAAETSALLRDIQAEMRGEPVAAGGHKPAVLHHFPTQFTPFIGRERELQQIEELFLDPDCRLVTLVGPGGIGKSRLSIRAAEQLAARAGLAEAIYFFPLAGAQTGESLLTNLLDGLGITPAARSAPAASLANSLRGRRCLLVLDNFEQLVGSAPLLAELLAAAPGARLLVTSQLPLQLSAERRLPLHGLDYPAGETGGDPLQFSAVHLFVESARHQDATFRLTPENAPDVIEICRLVQGMPLALELAAAWARLMDSAAIRREIGRSLDFLSLTPRDKPDRHQSMAAVFAYAWALLEPAERGVLGQLAVFRGPFSLDAAMEVTGATPLALARLFDRSLVQRRQDGGYELHELLRQFVGGQADARNDDAARRHSDYYLALVTAQEWAFFGPQPRQAVAAVQPYLANIRQAWQWAIDHDQRPLVGRSLEGLGRFYQVAALMPEGELMFAQATARFGDMPRLLVWHAYFAFKLGRRAEAIALAEQALAGAGSDELARAETYSLLGELLPGEGRFDAAKSHQQRAIEYFQATAELQRLARALRRMALICWRAGEHDQSLRYFEQAIPIHQAIEEKRGLAQLYNVLGGIYFEEGDLAQALACVEQSGELFAAIGEKLDAAVVSANQARLYAHLGRYEEALAANQRAIDASRELGDRAGLARDLSSRGFILAAVGDHDGSLDYYYRALEIARSMEDRGRMADFQAGLAAVYAAKGDDETAMAHYDLALPVLLAQGVPYHVVGPLLGKAELLIRREAWADARALLEQAEALAKGTDLADYIQRIHELEARIAEKSRVG